MGAVTTTQESHHGKQCCFCGSNGGYMARFEMWNEEKREYILRHLSRPPPSNISITLLQKSDRLEPRRRRHTHDHTPIWKQPTKEIYNTMRVRLYQRWKLLALRSVSFSIIVWEN